MRMKNTELKPKSETSSIDEEKRDLIKNNHSSTHLLHASLRKILGNHPFHLILGSTILGGLLTLFSDQLARLLFAPTELPVGMASTILGAPMMMYLAWRLK